MLLRIYFLIKILANISTKPIHLFQYYNVYLKAHERLMQEPRKGTDYSPYHFECWERLTNSFICLNNESLCQDNNVINTCQFEQFISYCTVYRAVCQYNNVQ